MNNNAIKWIEALRSGEYEQTTGLLEYKGKYCCLGVACEVAIKNGLDIKRENFNNFISYDGNYEMLPISVQQWLGLSSESCIVTLINANDDGTSFREIANFIEKHEDFFFKKD